MARFSFGVGERLLALQQALRDETWRPGPYTHFTISEPKQRLISAAPFADRVVHHALCSVIEPRFEASFIPWSYANRVGKGTHRAVDRVQALARQMTRPLVVAVIAAMGLVSSWLPFLDSRLMARWFSDGNFWWLSPVPLLTLAVAAALWRSATHPRRDLPPFLLSLALFVLGFLGLVLGMWPYLLPPSMTLWQAAAPASSLGFTLVGLVILLPVILGYTAWSYRVFRGKVHADTGYH